MNSLRSQARENSYLDSDKVKTSERTKCISVIIPLWRDDEALVPLVKQLAASPYVRETIISAAQPAPGLIASLHSLGAVCLESAEPNRGRQLNRGAQIATGDWLLFHHADSCLSKEHLAALADLDLSAALGGAFYRQFDERHPGFRWLERFERWHSRAFGTLYGDQSIFVQRTPFMSLGGFAAIPLMEDVEFSARLRRSGKVALLDPPMQSSPRQQIEQGAWKVTLRNLVFLVLFRCGISGDRLHAWYYGAPTTKDQHLRAVRERSSPSADAAASQ